MLEMYIGKENLPKDRKFIYDVEAAFNLIDKIKEDEEVAKVLACVENAKYVDEKTFCDKFGRNLYYDCLSTGSKALLLIKAFPDCIVNFMEAGYNTWNCLDTFKESKVYFPCVNGYDLQEDRDDLMLNGKRYYSTQDFNQALEELEYGTV